MAGTAPVTSDDNAISTQQEIFEFITTTIAPNQGVEFAPTANLLEAGILDSVGMMELIVWLEDHFQLTIDTDDLTPDNFATLDAMAAYVARRSAD